MLKKYYILIIIFIAYSSAPQRSPFAIADNSSTFQQPYYIEDVNVEFNLYEKTVVQLQINWKDNLPQDSLYNVVVNAIDPIQCDEMPCHAYGSKAPSRFITIPEYADSFVANRDCNIMLGCNYTLTLENTNLAMADSLNFSVPFCLLDTCSCRHAEYLPELSINAEVVNHDTITIEWFLQIKNSTQFDNKLQIYIRISEQTNPSLSWGGKLLSVIDELIPLDLMDNRCSIDKSVCTSSGYHNLNIYPNLTSQATLNLHATLLDQYNCSSLETILKLQVPSIDTSVEDYSAPIDKDIILIVAITMMLCLLVTLCVLYRRKLSKIEDSKVQSTFFTPTIVEMQENVNYIDKDVEIALLKGHSDLYEVPHRSIKLGPEIGQGAFGRVFKATAMNLHQIPGKTVVAVKQLKSNCSSDEINEFVSEIEMLKCLGSHENIVCILGCCTLYPPYLMIMEYVGGGDLLSYLRNMRIRRNKIISENSKLYVKYIELNIGSTNTKSDTENNSRQQKPSLTETTYTIIEDDEENNNFNSILDNKELQNFALQIANGMRFLEAQQIIHRDLAARNVLINDSKTLKVSDFGLSRYGIYTNTRARKLPLRWMSLEAIQDRIYTNKSDVWSYGVVLWEIGTLGASPYAAISNNELIPYLLAGNRLEKPEICTDSIYALMHQCWDQDVENRPSFQELYEILLPRALYVDLSSLSNDYVFPPIQNIDN